MKKSFEIESDCLDIVKRIKAIDKDYFVMFEPEKGQFELHNHDQGRQTYCLTFPFDTLDERAVSFTLKTRVQNSYAIIAEMDEYNKRLEQNAIKEVLDDFKEKLYDS